MGTEFAIRRISPGLLKALQDFSKLTVDLFWKSDLIDDDDFWTEDKIQKDFSRRTIVNLKTFHES